MRAGILDKKVEFYKMTTRRDDTGQLKTSWTYQYTTRAHLFTQSGSKNVINYEMNAIHNKIFWVRIYLQFDENYRIKYENKYYDIKFIDVDDAQQCKKITCEDVNE